MTPTASIPPLGFEFDNFLFALVGEDRNGMPLSVVSVLARMELDPWVEAASLADLPAETAARKLAAWLDALPDPTLKAASPDTRAARLIALLPRRKTPNSPPPVAATGAVAGTGAVAPAKPRALTKAILVAIYLILSLCIQLFIARREAPASPELMHAPASTIVPPSGDFRK
ncbi:MAG: hypothetical protein JWL65_2444 [Gammaproteobacteria bacterium]|jgi:hypothetical protein|nr:hypothetical protein [Gammaproteobacteria bacterium]